MERYALALQIQTAAPASDFAIADTVLTDLYGEYDALCLAVDSAYKSFRVDIDEIMRLESLTRIAQKRIDRLEREIHGEAE